MAACGESFCGMIFMSFMQYACQIYPQPCNVCDQQQLGDYEAELLREEVEEQADDEESDEREQAQEIGEEEMRELSDAQRKELGEGLADALVEGEAIIEEKGEVEPENG